uniref:Uncharacterized protein n=1 Tax=Opuntia streptacantha TaxID=393608 RepID=A0A7C9EW61_OPUST
MSLQRQIQLMSQCQARQRNPHPFTLLQTNAQILNKMLHIKPRLKIPLQYPSSVQIQRLRPSRPSRNRIQKQTQIQFRFMGINHPFNQPHHSRCNCNLIRQFCILPFSRPTHVVSLP